MKKLLIIIIAILFFVNGCGFTGFGVKRPKIKRLPYYSDRDVEFAMDYDIVWQAVIDVLYYRNENINTFVKGSGMINTNSRIIDEKSLYKIANIPKGALEPKFQEGRYKLDITLMHTSLRKVIVAVNANIEAYQTLIEPYGWSALRSNGTLENDILFDIAVKIKDYKRQKEKPRGSSPTVPSEETADEITKDAEE